MKTETQYLDPVGFKGTPGEWYLNNLNFSEDKRLAKLSVDVDEKDNDDEWRSYCIADIKPTTSDKWEYDAKLISQSKELAKALQDMRKACKQMMADDDISHVLASMGKHTLMKTFAENYKNTEQVLKDAGLTDKH